MRARRAFPGILDPPALQTQPNCSIDLAHIRRDASAASVSPNYYWMGLAHIYSSYTTRWLPYDSRTSHHIRVYSI